MKYMVTPRRKEMIFYLWIQGVRAGLGEYSEITLHADVRIFVATKENLLLFIE